MTDIPDDVVEAGARAICKAALADTSTYGDEICCQFAPASRRREGGHNWPDRPGPLRCCREDFDEEAEAAILAYRKAMRERGVVECSWNLISTLPDSDDLIWLYNAGTRVIVGPRPPGLYDADEFTHWAPCEPPAMLAAVEGDGE